MYVRIVECSVTERCFQLISKIYIHYFKVLNLEKFIVCRFKC
jgi:hypothetical protein